MLGGERVQFGPACERITGRRPLVVSSNRIEREYVKPVCHQAAHRGGANAARGTGDQGNARLSHGHGALLPLDVGAGDPVKPVGDEQIRGRELMNR